MYTIGQVSEMFHLPISTLRYYDKEGFFPNLERKGNIRYFSDNELEAIRVIECLKKSGLEIKDIKQFFIYWDLKLNQLFTKPFIQLWPAYSIDCRIIHYLFGALYFST